MTEYNISKLVLYNYKKAIYEPSSVETGTTTIINTSVLIYINVLIIRVNQYELV